MKKHELGPRGENKGLDVFEGGGTKSGFFRVFFTFFDILGLGSF